VGVVAREAVAVREHLTLSMSKVVERVLLQLWAFRALLQLLMSRWRCGCLGEYGSKLIQREQRKRHIAVIGHTPRTTHSAQVHGDAMVQTPVLRRIGQRLLTRLKPVWGRLDALMQDTRCMVAYFGNLQ